MIDYLAASENYRPGVIRTLLVGEAPPPSGNKYFYVPARLPRYQSIRKHTSLPATIFYHYFRKLPVDESEYATLLAELKAMGVFLVDIVDEPINVRGSEAGVQRIKEAILEFRRKLEDRSIDVIDEDIIFLLPRRHYRSDIKREFPDSKLYQWIDFRLQGYRS